jgi:hypothetical protein
MANGYGYQPTDINTPVPNSDLGALNVRSSVAEAGAGMDKIAQAGKETESVADKIQRQEDMNAVLKAKGSSSTELNQAWLDFQPKMTGNIQQDQASWEAISSKIGQKYLGQLGNPTQQGSFTKEYDALHNASIIQVQNQSIKDLNKSFRTETAGLLANNIKTAFAIVKAGGPDYVAQVEQQYQNYAAVINASPLLSQAEKDALLQGGVQHFYMEVAKNQAETTPGAFSRDWRDGVWTKHLTPEAVNQLQPLAEKAQVDSAYNVVTQQFTRPGGNVDYAAAAKWILDPKNYPDMPASMRMQVNGMFKTADAERWQQIERGRHEYEYGIQTTVQKMVAEGKLVEAQELVRKSKLPISSANSIQANIQAGGYKRDDLSTYGMAMDMVTNGTWSDNWGLQQINSGKLSDQSYERFRKLFREADIPTIAEIKDGQNAIKQAFAKPMMSGGTQEQAEAELSALREYSAAIDEARKQGKSPRGFATPGSPNYILGDIIRRNTLTMQQQAQAMSNRMSPGEQQSAPVRPAATKAVEQGLGMSSPGTSDSGVPLRIHGETVDQYRRRVGGM